MSDIDTGARTVFGEARNQPLIGKIGVAHVIMNRVLADLHNDKKPDWWGEGVEQVCRKPGQFSCWLTTDPNRLAIERADLTDKAFAECLAVFAFVYLARRGNTSIPRPFASDPTFGSTHYKVRSLPWPKDWGPVRASTSELGDHSFFAGIEPGYTIPVLGTIS